MQVHEVVLSVLAAGIVAVILSVIDLEREESQAKFAIYNRFARRNDGVRARLTARGLAASIDEDGIERWKPQWWSGSSPLLAGVTYAVTCTNAIGVVDIGRR